MKKFLAIVMCLAMALSMMTVVSFAADGGTYEFGTVKCTEGTAVTLDVPFTLSSTAVVKSGGLKIKSTALPAGITFATSADAMTVNPALDFDGLFNAAKTKAGYVKATKLHNFNWAVQTDCQTAFDKTLIGTIHVNVAATVAAGSYTVDFTPVLKDAAGGDVTVEIAVPLTIVVEEDKPAAPSAAIVDVPTEENASLKVITVTGTATEFGIKYTGSDADWAGQEFPSKAPAGTTTAAVKVVGLTGDFVGYAR